MNVVMVAVKESRMLHGSYCRFRGKKGLNVSGKKALSLENSLLGDRKCPRKLYSATKAPRTLTSSAPNREAMLFCEALLCKPG